jgi:hypothetical protein
MAASAGTLATPGASDHAGAPTNHKEKAMINPTVGRVVWFHPPTNAAEGGFAAPDAGQPLAAIIARVWSERMVNLTVFDANGVPHSRTSVVLVQEGEPVPQNGYYAEWMPYQIGQAKKHEVETKTYAGGTSATGNAPLPEQSPAEQLADAVREEPRKATLTPAAAWPFPTK